MTEEEAKEKMTDAFLDYSFEVIKCVFIALDSILSQCNSFEDFKISVKQTIDDLTKTGEEND